MVAAVTPFLMFQGSHRAETAMALYVSLFPDAEILSIERYGPSEQGAEGSVKVAAFRLAGQTVKCIDSPVRHAFDFTPSFSFFIDCDSEEELTRLSTALAEDGSILMPADDYGFSRRFTWINDRFGVSWQINLP
ncbi:VOC family protein [Ensifer canadensis]